MSKRPQFWTKFKTKNSCEETKISSSTSNNVGTNVKKDENVSDASIRTQRSNNQFRKYVYEETKIGKEIICEHCNERKTKNTKPSPKTICNLLDRTKLNSDYIDTLVSKITELKNYIKLFEGHYGVKSNSRIHQENNPSVPLLNQGDNFVLQQHSSDEERGKCHNRKACGHKRPTADFQKSIYTVNERLTRGQNVPSTHKQRNSRPSIVMAMSNQPSESTQFQLTADEFINQAEALKSKIAFLLDYCGCNSTCGVGSEHSTATIQSVASYRSSNTCHKGSSDTKSSNEDMKSLLGTVNRQYKDILASLSLIENQIGNLGKLKKEKSLTRDVETSKTDSFINMHKMGCAFDKISEDQPFRVEKKTQSARAHVKDRRHASGLEEAQRDLKRNSPTEVWQNFVKTGRHNDVLEKNLEPIVMVYEPIHPACGDSGPVCKHCGQSVNSCAGTCSDASVVETDNTSSYIRKKSETKQKYGFVVTYTPDISEMSDINTRNKKKTNCLWF